ncbi:MAG TPA: M48 family metallopeptidase [Beijerinckiaceae bacterium]|nr:M48 family metallopeptidase [Beijerinckiaceae bacterium]
MDQHCPGAYFDGVSSRRRDVTVRIDAGLEIIDGDVCLAEWSFLDLRQLDSLPDTLKVRSVAAPELASLTIADPTTIEAIRVRAARLRYDGQEPRHGILRIVALSLAAAVSILGVAFFGVPKMARAVASITPVWAERKLGDAVAGQVKVMFGGEVCVGGEGGAALAKLSEKLTVKARLPHPVRIEVLSSRIPNAVALPGGRVFLFDGLLARAEHPDEVAGVLGHEIGHEANRDGLRALIEAGGTSFLLGLLFGDLTGSATLVLVVREIISSAHSREAEAAADIFGRDLMHALGRPAAPLARVLTRIDPSKPGAKGSIFDSHPLTAERLKRLEAADASLGRPLDGPPLLNEAEWAALKTICAKK